MFQIESLNKTIEDLEAQKTQLSQNHDLLRRKLDEAKSSISEYNVSLTRSPTYLLF